MSVLFRGCGNKPWEFIFVYNNVSNKKDKWKSLKMNISLLCFM